MRLPNDDFAADVMFCDPRAQNMHLAYYAAAAATATFQGPLKPLKSLSKASKSPFKCLYNTFNKSFNGL